MPPNTTSLRSILMLCSILRLGLPSGLPTGLGTGWSYNFAEFVNLVCYLMLAPCILTHALLVLMSHNSSTCSDRYFPNHLLGGRVFRKRSYVPSWWLCRGFKFRSPVANSFNRLFVCRVAQKSFDTRCWTHCLYKVVQILPGRFVCKQVTVCPGHIWTTLYQVVFASSCMLYVLIYVWCEILENRQMV
jgi:hypothetical protein